MLFFFFSSRRRHTRWPRDWSSDVCSSDLPQALDMHEVLEGAIHGESCSPTRGGAGEPRQLRKSFVEPSIWLLEVEKARQSDGPGDRGDAKELAGASKEQVE